MGENQVPFYTTCTSQETQVKLHSKTLMSDSALETQLAAMRTAISEKRITTYADIEFSPFFG